MVSFLDVLTRVHSQAMRRARRPWPSQAGFPLDLVGLNRFLHEGDENGMTRPT